MLQKHGGFIGDLRQLGSFLHIILQLDSAHLEDVDFVVAGSAVDHDAAQAACDIAVFILGVHDVAVNPACHHECQNFLLKITLALASGAGNEKHTVGDLVIPLEDVGIHRATAVGTAQRHTVRVNETAITEWV